jgi:hypothetical protein
MNSRAVVTKPLTKPTQIDLTEILARPGRSFLLTARSGLYTLVILAIVIGAGAYSMRNYSIFSCSASRYTSDGYLCYCNGKHYGDYDHGAFWFGLQPAATAAAVNAQVLFVGNSRTAFAFSTPVTVDWFSALAQSYYLLSFSHDENYTFEAPLIHRLHPKAKVYVINIDTFFEGSETGPGKTLLHDDSAKGRYEQKRFWQPIHKAICSRFPFVCGDDIAFFRSGSAGAWHVTGGPFTSEPVSYNDAIDPDKLAAFTARGNEFLPSLGDDSACTILTVVPSVKTPLGTARATAAALGKTLVAPRLDGLVTFDRLHLDPASARRWSAAFLEEAGPQIRKCLGE